MSPPIYNGGDILVYRLLSVCLSVCPSVCPSVRHTCRFRSLTQTFSIQSLPNLMKMFVGWIKNLQTPFPLGLNEIIYQSGNISKDPSIDIFSVYSNRIRKSRCHGTRKNGILNGKHVFKLLLLIYITFSYSRVGIQCYHGFLPYNYLQ